MIMLGVEKAVVSPLWMPPRIFGFYLKPRISVLDALWYHLMSKYNFSKFENLTLAKDLFYSFNEEPVE